MTMPDGTPLTRDEFFRWAESFEHRIDQRFEQVQAELDRGRERMHGLATSLHAADVRVSLIEERADGLKSSLRGWTAWIAGVVSAIVASLFAWVLSRFGGDGP